MGLLPDSPIIVNLIKERKHFLVALVARETKFILSASRNVSSLGEHSSQETVSCLLQRPAREGKGKGGGKEAEKYM